MMYIYDCNQIKQNILFIHCGDMKRQLTQGYTYFICGYLAIIYILNYVIRVKRVNSTEVNVFS